MVMEGVCSDAKVVHLYIDLYHIIYIIDTFYYTFLYTYPTGLQGFKLRESLYFFAQGYLAL